LLQAVAVAGILGLVVAVCLLMPGTTGGDRKKDVPSLQPPASPKESHETKVSSPEGAGAGLPVKLVDGIGQLGPTEAKVHIEVYIPGHSGCGNETADFAHRVYKANADRIRLTFVDFESPSGSKRQSAAGAHCQGMAINGKQSFAVGGSKPVNLGSGLGDQWNDTQFFRALDAEFMKAYGRPANHKISPKPSPAGSTKSGAPEVPKQPPHGGKA
jgi:hypothetical protein